MSAMCKGGANTENHILTRRGRCSTVHTARMISPSQSGEQSRTEQKQAEGCNMLREVTFHATALTTVDWREDGLQRGED